MRSGARSSVTDLVERLRKVECVERELAHDCDMPPEGTANWEYAETCKEAANEIERMTGGVLQMESAMSQQIETIERLRAALKAITEVPADWGNEVYEMLEIARAALEGK